MATLRCLDGGAGMKWEFGGVPLELVFTSYGVAIGLIILRLEGSYQTNSVLK